MIKLVILSFSLVLSSAAFSCEIKLWEKIFIAANSKTNNWKDLIVSSNCDEATEIKVTQFLTMGKGTIQTGIISHELGLADLILSPSKVRVSQLSNYLKTSTSLAHSFEVENLSLIDGNKYIALNNLDNLKIICEQCTRLGEAPLQIQIERAGSLETVWAKALITQKVVAYFPKKHIGINQKYLDSDDFEAKNISTKNPEELFTNFSNIEFFMTVRALNPESPVKRNDLYAQNLVSPQALTDVIMSTGKMTLSTKGYPVKAARYGEIINIRNPESNRLIQAKVIGRNKVVVE